MFALNQLNFSFIYNFINNSSQLIIDQLIMLYKIYKVNNNDNINESIKINLT